MMNVVNAGRRFQIYGEDLKTYKQLPIGSYDVNFDKFTGFFLTTRPDLAANEEKIYGNHLAKVQKVIRSFQLTDRNFGIILSGQKGIGKSLFARLLAQEGIKNNLPIITVTQFIPGIAEFISSIEQEVIVVFDEFEKTFASNDDFDPQETMLSLFDGMDNGKKLFVITCNDTYKLNDFLVNRPGRFHYHFTLTNPNADEVREYMTDKLDPKYHAIIDKIVDFSHTINMTYDYLRAIAFELNQGYSLEEALSDLNITRTADLEFNVTLRMSDGNIYSAYEQSIDLYRSRVMWLNLWSSGCGKSNRIQISFAPTDIVYKDGVMTLPLDKMHCSEYDDDDWDDDNPKETRAKPISVSFAKCENLGVYRYCV